MSDFKVKIKDEIQKSKLTETQLKNLQNLQIIPFYKNVRHISVLGVISAACLAIVFYFQFNLSLNQKIANEVVYNHLKNMPSEYLVSEYSKINASLPKLNFIVKTSPRLSDLTLIGARYCSIQGNIAAQIQLKDQKGKRYTLYQYRLVDSTRKKEELVEIKEMKVQLWSEGDINFALTQDLN